MLDIMINLSLWNLTISGAFTHEMIRGALLIACITEIRA